MGGPPGTKNLGGWRDGQSDREMEYNNTQANQMYTIHAASSRLTVDVYLYVHV